MLKRGKMPERRGVIERYRRFLPISGHTPICTLLEGDTPLIASTAIGPEMGIELYFKYEGLNPTASFKDRGMTVAISKAREEGAVAVICASTGNTSASAAAYAARAGIKCAVVIPEGKIAAGKLAQALAHGAAVVAIDGNFDQALKIVRELTEKQPITLVNSINPYRLEGQKTAAFEICDELGDAPDYLFIPVGNAGNISAYWMGFCQYLEAGLSIKRPKMIGWQAEGAAPIVLGHPVEKPETVATAIRIGNPVRWQQAREAADVSGGFIDMVSDAEILDAYETLANREGLFVEPASAASVAGLRKSIAAGKIDKNGRIVCVLTGHGLKDPAATQLIRNKIRQAASTVEAVEKILLTTPETL